MRRGADFLTVIPVPLVTVKLEAGVYSDEQKARLIDEITEVVLDVAAGAVEVDGGLPDKTWVLVEEVKPGNWGIGGRAVHPVQRQRTYDPDNVFRGNQNIAPKRR
jgi:4-oxalocrotonate tautomerase